MATESEIQSGVYGADSDLLSTLKAYEDGAKQFDDEAREKRKLELNDYERRGYPGDDQLVGRSKHVASDVFDTVETILAESLDKFFGGDKLVEFQPRRKDEERAAKDATNAVNYVFGVQNNGFLTTYTVLKDALMHGRGALHWYAKTEKHVEHEGYEGILAEELAVIEANGEIELLEASERTEQAVIEGEMAEIPVFDVKIRRTSYETKIVVDPLAPEELLVWQDHTSPILDDCRYVCIKRLVTVSELRDMGYDVSDEQIAESDELRSEESQMRGGSGIDDYANVSDETLREVWMRTEFVLHDSDGDGIAERRRVVRLDNIILEDDPFSHVPIAIASPFLKQHRWDGMSLWDVVHDLQELHTSLWREMRDSLALANSPRLKVLTDSKGKSYGLLDDVLQNRIGGLIRVAENPQGTAAVEPMVHQWAGYQAMPMLENVQAQREERTGATRYNQGTDASSLNHTATGIMQIMSAGQRRLQLMFRIMAEVLFKPAAAGIFRLLTEGHIGAIAARIDDEYVELDPSQFRGDYDLIVKVGLGNGSKAEQTQFLQGAFQQMMAMLGTPAGQLITPDRIFNIWSELFQNAGFRQPERFIMNPESEEAKQNPPPPPPPNPEQVKAEMEMQKFQAEQQAEIQRFQAQAEIDRQKAAADFEAEKQKQAMEIAAREREAEANRQAQIAIAQIREAAALEREQLKIEAQKEAQREQLNHQAAMERKRQRKGNEKPSTSE